MAKKRFYLSIDMDFWNDIDDEQIDSLKKSLSDLIGKAKRLKIPIHAVVSHHQLLNFVNRTRFNQLINIDYHSDLADKRTKVLNCGTWLSYVANRRKSQYVWYHNSILKHGECNGRKRIFRRKGVNKSLSDWKSLKHIQSTEMPTINLNNCVGIGLVLSPDYSYNCLKVLFYKLIKKYKIKLHQGRYANDEYRKKITIKDFLKQGGVL